MKKVIFMLVIPAVIPCCLVQACELDSFVSGVERNTSSCNSELSKFVSPQPGGQCVSLISSVERLNDYLSGTGVYGCSSYQKDRARNAASEAISTLRRAQGK